MPDPSDPAAPPTGGGLPVFVAAVLTGGASRRMGRDKATLLVDGVAMAARVCEAARAAGAAATVCVGLEVPGEAHLADDHPGEGPLGGLLTALGWAGDRPVAVLGCDLLAPSPAAIRRAVAELTVVGSGGRAHPDAAVPVVGGRDQWLHGAWWPAGALGPLAAAFGTGERSLHRAAAGLEVHRYEEADRDALADADVPADLPAGPEAPAGWDPPT